VEISAPAAITDTNISGACPTKPDAMPFLNQKFDPFRNGSLDVLIAVTVSVTFGIR
jgi:hypothetical protein